MAVVTAGLQHEQEPPPSGVGPGLDAAQAAGATLAPRPTKRAITSRVVAILMTLDVVALVVAMIGAFLIREALPAGPDVSGAGERHLLLAAVGLPVWLVAFSRSRLYSPVHTASGLEELRRVTWAVAGGVVLIAAAGFTLKVYVARSWLVLAGILAVLTVLAGRRFARRLISRQRAQGRLLRTVLIAGTNQEARDLFRLLDSSPHLGYTPLGFLSDLTHKGEAIEGHPVLGGFHDAPEVAARMGAAGVVLATTALDHEVSNRMARRLTEAGLVVELTSSLRDIAHARLLVRPLGPFPVLHLDPVRHHGWRASAKRAFDLTGSLVVGLIAIPLLLAAAMAVKLCSRGPILFRQQRVGRAGIAFEILKFRTMVVGSDVAPRPGNEADGPLFKAERDPRCTRVGRVLRALSIDELPQLWNVLKGEMSLVGPRPALPCEVAAWPAQLHQRLRVKPGITGMWQVSGSGRWSSFEEYERLDLYYVDNWSLWTDLAIVARTVPTVMLRRGTR